MGESHVSAIASVSDTVFLIFDPFQDRISHPLKCVPRLTRLVVGLKYPSPFDARGIGFWEKVEMNWDSVQELRTELRKLYPNVKLIVRMQHQLN